MLLAIQYPSWLHPEIIPGLPFLRWYGLMYLVAFGIAYFLFSYQVNKGEFERYSSCQKAMTQDDISDLFIWGILGLILGARIFGTLVYNPETYLKAPWFISHSRQPEHYAAADGVWRRTVRTSNTTENANNTAQIPAQAIVAA